MPSQIKWPRGKRFAFTVFDDTDRSTVENTAPVYALLKDMEMRTTKSVWPLRGTRKPTIPGATCEDPDYLDWISKIQAEGFEIGYHLATYHDVERKLTQDALFQFYNLFGHYPKTMANHHHNLDAIYWGNDRLTGVRRNLLRALTLGQASRKRYGHIEGDPRFWGDLCRQHIRYVRNFVFKTVNTLEACPYMPYSDPAFPHVNLWFASSDGGDVHQWNKLLTEEAIDELEEAGGCCIMYTHFAKGFYKEGALDPGFKKTIAYIASKNGWFAPVREVLDHLVAQGNGKPIDDEERADLEWRWLLGKVFPQLAAA